METSGRAGIIVARIASSFVHLAAAVPFIASIWSRGSFDDFLQKQGLPIMICEFLVIHSTFFILHAKTKKRWRVVAFVMCVYGPFAVFLAFLNPTIGLLFVASSIAKCLNSVASPEESKRHFTFWIFSACSYLVTPLIASGLAALAFSKVASWEQFVSSLNRSMESQPETLALWGGIYFLSLAAFEMFHKGKQR